MTKRFLYIFLLVVAVSSCRKDNDPLFSETPDQRLEKKLGAYQEQLSSAPFGWKLLLQPAGGGAYSFYVKFNSENRVQMVSDFDSSSAVKVEESSYRLKALQQPSIIFDTYSYLHVLSDPDARVNDGEWGLGLQSDFEFYFSDTTSSDTLHLTGRVNGSKAILVRATQEESQSYTNGDFNVNLFSSLEKKILQYFKQFTINGKSYDLIINPRSRKITFTWLDDQGNSNSFFTSFYFSLRGIEFIQAFVIDNLFISGFYDPSWSDATRTITINTGGSALATVRGIVKPQALDVQAANRWWQRMVDEDGYWVSLKGFHVDGLDDAYGLTGIKDFVALSFFPKYNSYGGITYDLAGYLMTEDGQLTLSFGTAFEPPAFTADGRIVFGDYLGDLGDIPADAMEPYVNTALKLMESEGFFLVQTGDDEYDMVSATNGQSWINWFAP